MKVRATGQYVPFPMRRISPIATNQLIDMSCKYITVGYMTKTGSVLPRILRIAAH